MLLHLPRAAIFDLDGTVVDNMALHAEAFAVFAERHGLPELTPADRAKLDGRRNSEILPVLFGRELAREEWLAYEHEKEGLYREISRGRLTVVAGCATGKKLLRHGQNAELGRPRSDNGRSVTNVASSSSRTGLVRRLLTP